MKLHTEFIKAQFQNIAQTYHLKWIKESDYGIALENDKIEISMSAERWEEGVTMSLTNKQQKEFYYVWDLDIKNGFAKNMDNHLSIQEKEYMVNSLPDDEKLIYSFKIMLERYCQEALQGNFSKLGKGRPE